MVYSQSPLLTELISNAFRNAVSIHSDLGLRFEDYYNRIITILNRHEANSAASFDLQGFFQRFHLNDLYLSEACAAGEEAAWQRFIDIYKKFISNLARFCCGSQDRGIDLADRVLADLFFPDRSGISRIGSFDGRVSLASWLDVVVRRKAIDESMLKANRCEPVDLIDDLADTDLVEQVFADLRGQIYGTAIRESLQLAVSSLSDRERLLLLLKYEKELLSSEIATIFGVSASTVSRQLQSIQIKLRTFVLGSLSDDHAFGEAAIQECVEDLIENPAYSLLTLLAHA